MHEEYLALIQDFQTHLSSLDAQNVSLFATHEEIAALASFKNTAPPSFLPDFVPEKKSTYVPYEKIKEEVVEIVQPKAVPKKSAAASLNPVFDEFNPLIEKFLPGLKIAKTPPSDHNAQKRSHQWETNSLQAEVIVFSSGASGLEEEFLNNIALAISAKLCLAKKLTVKIIEESSDWKLLCESGKIRLVIASSEAFSFGPFLQLIRKNTASQEVFLGNIPLLALKPFATYTQDPHEKKQLWNRLCQILKALPVS